MPLFHADAAERLLSSDGRHRAASRLFRAAAPLFELRYAKDAGYVALDEPRD